MSFARTSADVVGGGDVVTVDWRVEDVPAFYVAFYFYDALGNRHQATYSGEPVYSGSATLTIDSGDVAAGALTLRSVLVQAGRTQVDYRSDGVFYKSPSGIKDPKATVFDLTKADFSV
ncbi:hypothetical protein, partial [Pseudarthrobacter enclensis]|uniref:hypothetical protein n=1 Tax=Pseudarthrobacter enclensis TaxID=993070 RepID=UPI003EE19A0B